jgi:hypothetical protein
MGPEILFVIPYALGLTVAATVVAVLAIWVVWAALRRWGPGAWRADLAIFPTGIMCSCLISITLPAGCAWALRPVEQPQSNQNIATLEILLPEAQERAALLTLVNREAVAEGLEIQIMTPDGWRLFDPTRPGDLSKILAVIQRRDDVGATEAIIASRSTPGQIALTFLRGKNVALARRFRERVTPKITASWRQTVSAPITPPAEPKPTREPR